MDKYAWTIIKVICKRIKFKDEHKKNENFTGLALFLGVQVKHFCYERESTIQL